jgi:isovaleryl-CoA dehydrogenase
MQLARAAFTALRHQNAFTASGGVCLSRLFSSSKACAAEQHHITPEALREFRENVREFAHTVVAPHAEHVDRSNNFPTEVDLWKEMGEFGLLGKF